MIQLRDTLLPNTTYALNFGSALRDNNEGNPLHSMRYVFSTGPEIDSMIMSGYTADAYKADSVSKSFIWFFPADSVGNVAEYDSTIFKYKPAVIARAENNGVFIAQNLKPIPYRVYAVKDVNDNQMYEPGTDRVGFLEGAFNPARMPDFAIWYDSLRQYVSAEPQLYLRMFTDRAFRRQVLSQSERPQQHKAMLYFSAARPQIDSIRFEGIPDDGFIIDPQTVGRDTLAVWFTVPSAQLPDTIRGSVTYFKHDSVNVLQRVTEPLKLPWRMVETKEQQREREKLERDRRKAEEAGEEWIEPRKPSLFGFKLPLSGEVNPENHLAVDFDYPLARVDSAALLLTVTSPDNSVEDLPVRLVRDTALLRRWYLRAPWKPDGKYTLTIPAGPSPTSPDSPTIRSSASIPSSLPRSMPRSSSMSRRATACVTSSSSSTAAVRSSRSAAMSAAAACVSTTWRPARSVSASSRTPTATANGIPATWCSGVSPSAPRCSSTTRARRPFPPKPTGISSSRWT